MIELYNGDCLEVMKNIPDKSVDLVVTDPPYKFASGGGGGAFGNKKRKHHAEYLALYHETKNESDRINANKVRNREEIRAISNGFDIKVLDELERIMKKTNIYIWCSKAQIRQILCYYEDKGYSTEVITWHRTNPVPTCNNTYLSDTDYLIFARAKNVKVYGTYHTKKKYYVSKANVEDKKKYGHPTIKPLNIIENLIINSSLEGQTVLDPFLGSGTTGVASKKLNRDFIGIELNKEYFEIAKKRIEETNAQIRMF